MGAAQDNLGSVYYALGDARHAIKFYKQSLVVFHEIGDRRGEGNALANMGQAFKTLGEPARARESWQQALALTPPRHGRRPHLPPPPSMLYSQFVTRES